MTRNHVQVVAGLPPTCRVAFITFAGGVHIFDLSGTATVSATTAPGHTRMMPEVVEHFRNSGVHARGLCPLEECQHALKNAINSLR